MTPEQGVESKPGTAQAIFITGMNCPLCGLLRDDSAEVCSLPVFIANICQLEFSSILITSIPQYILNHASRTR